MLPQSSPRSGAPLVLRPRCSRRAWSIWALQLAVLTGAALAVGSPVYVKISALLTVLAHAAWSWPRPEATTVRVGDGRWNVARGPGSDLVLDSDTVYTRDWAELRLVGMSSRCRTLLLWSDALAADDWRRLQLELREPKWPRAGRAACSRRPAGAPAHWT